MNPDDRPRTLSPDRVEWVPSSPDAIEVRVFGTWHGSTVPPAAVLLLNGDRVEELGTPPGDDVPPAWSASFLVPVESRSAVEGGDALLDVGGFVVALPPATPGRMVEPASDIGTLVDPAVLAERRARRAEIAEQSAAERAASAEQEASTLRTQLEHIEERLARAASERDSLASRVADAERRLRLAEQREEAERRRRGELEEELAAERRSVEQEVHDLSDRLASAEEVTEALERELAAARRREEAERAAREHVDEQLRVALARVTALEGEAGDEEEELRRQAAVLADRLAEAEAERARLETIAADLDQLRVRLESAEREHGDVEELRRRLAEAESARDEVAGLRRRLEEADRERGEVEELQQRLAEVNAERGEVEELRRRVAEVEDLRERLAAAEAERDELRARLEAATPGEDAELRRRLDETLALLDREREAHAATEHARKLAVQRTREAREAASQGGGSSSEREQELAEQVTALQSEIAARAETHQRVQHAIEAVRSELGRVRAHVLEERAATGPEIEALNERVRLLEDLVRRRDAELDLARAALADAQRVADEARSSSADADTLRADFQVRIRELSAAVAEMRERLRETTSDFERRLADERTRREAAEAALAALQAAPPAPPAAPTPPAEMSPSAETTPPADESTESPRAAPAGDDALEALIAGLREQVDTAREQLRAWDMPPEPVEPPAPAPEDSAPEAHVPAPDTPAAPSVEDATRERLRAIEADIRATVPDAESSVPAREVIASLQQAADRLRAAAEEELAHIDAEESAAPDEPRVEDVGALADVASATVETGAEPEPQAGETIPPEPPPLPETARPGRATPEPSRPGRETPAPLAPGGAVPLGARDVDFGAAESPWLRTAIERLAQSDPGRAADLLVSLLPLQARAGLDLTYVLTAPSLGAVRVVLASGAVQVERRPSSLSADARVSGSIATLAPLVAGGGGRRAKGVRIEGAKRPAKKLLRRRATTGLGDFALVTPAPAPDLVLGALAAAVEPAWTRGHRFGVAYDVEGERWTVLATDGEPLRVTGAFDEPHAATVALSRDALLTALQGAASGAVVAGDRRAVDVLHAWFDRARGVAAG